MRNWARAYFYIYLWHGHTFNFWQIKICTVVPKKDTENKIQAWLITPTTHLVLMDFDRHAFLHLSFLHQSCYRKKMMVLKWFILFVGLMWIILLWFFNEWKWSTMKFGCESEKNIRSGASKEFLILRTRVTREYLAEKKNSRYLFACVCVTKIVNQLLCKSMMCFFSSSDLFLSSIENVKFPWLWSKATTKSI